MTARCEGWCRTSRSAARATRIALTVEDVPEPLKAEVSGGEAFEIGATVELTWEPEACRLLPRDPGVD